MSYVRIIGLAGLLLPGLSAPPLTGSLLMLAAGIAWGVYSLRGKGAGDVRFHCYTGENCTGDCKETGGGKMIRTTTTGAMMSEIWSIQNV